MVGIPGAWGWFGKRAVSLGEGTGWSAVRSDGVPESCLQGVIRR